MTTDRPIYQKEKLEALKKKVGALDRLGQALMEYCTAGYDPRQTALVNLIREMEKACGKPLRDCHTQEEFWNKALLKSLKNLLGPEFAEEAQALCAIRARGQFSDTVFRRSFRSGDFGLYAERTLRDIRGWLQFHCYDCGLAEMLRRDHGGVTALPEMTALAIDRGDAEIIGLIREMILGDNNVLLSRGVIVGVILSRDRDLKELLMKLLLASGRQEGLRQAILESADAGDAGTLEMILKVCVENDLFRFSGAARAFYTWTGLGGDGANAALTARLGRTALDCLQSPEERRKYQNSENPLEVYLALWAEGCRELADTERDVEALLSSEKKYRKLLGWYFVQNTEEPAFRHSLAVRHLDETDEEVLAYLTEALYFNWSTVNGYAQKEAEQYRNGYLTDKLPADRSERYEQFRRLRPIVEHIGKRTWTFDPSLFPWRQVILNQEKCKALRCMFSLAAWDKDPQMIRELWELRDLFEPSLRMAFYRNLLDPDHDPEHRAWLYEGLRDRSQDNRAVVLRKLKHCRPEAGDTAQICAALKSKSAPVKKAAVDCLKARPLAHRLDAVRVLADGGEGEVQAALELMIEDADLADQCRDLLEAIRRKPQSSQTKLLLDQLSPESEQEELTEANGWGLYRPETVEAAVRGMPADREFWSAKKILGLFPAEKEILELMEKLNAVFEAHRDYEYEYLRYDGQRVKVLFGNIDSYSLPLPIPAQYGEYHKLIGEGKVTFDMIPFYEEFEAVLRPWTSNAKRFCALLYLCESIPHPGLKEVLPWISDFCERFGSKLPETLYKRYGNRARQLQSVVWRALELADGEGVFSTACAMYFGLCHILGESKLTEPYSETKYFSYSQKHRTFSCPILQIPRGIIKRLTTEDRAFECWFREEYWLEKQLGHEIEGSLGLPDYLRAYRLGLIPVDCLYEWVLRAPDGPYSSNQSVSTLTNKKRPWKEDREVQSAIDRLVQTIIRFEAKRGQAETPLSAKALQIRYCEGAEYFVLLLSALGKETFHRGYVWTNDRTKNAVLSSLLKVCRPAPGDTAEKLKALLKGTDIKEKRLVEAAMYAPQWARLIEALIGWPGLKKGVWFFQAHISERFSSEKETETAIYSPISPQQFNDGTFDVNWFRESWAELGEKRFRALYDSAKYITEGSNAHKRSQLYTDAVTGKLEIGALEKEIAEKRNQERLRAYGLIPVEPGDTKELVRRYGFIAAYLKGARQFGAQRRESETKAARVALENLAITCGEQDVNRLLWRLEKARLEELQPCTEKKTVEGFQVYLRFDEEGDCELRIEKDGKLLKTVPKALAKDPLTEEYKQTVKELREQKLRGRRTLEEAMVNRSSFRPGELASILDCLTLAPLLRRLVWRTEDDRMGLPFLENGKLLLENWNGERMEIGAGETLWIAHPHDLKRAGHWTDWMHKLYETGLVQPFKQVFRELYPITDEEREERTVSRRYTGYQVQPKKAVALLRSRGWTVDYEEGLQKVSYPDNIIVRLYAQADWFSPADYEVPTIEELSFVSRRDEKPLVLEDVDPILFSETMRDLDLAVSAAAAGGVDPETSHSTVEMRVAIAKELTALLKLKNVSFTERHARISGKLAEYSVHMGSGVVHALGKGMVPILAVHSQQRGRIFLPFADEDPKTAEILSKIILLAEDEKIKDPSILDALR